MEPEIAAAGSVGCIETPRGRLPLAAVSVTADVWGPSAKVIVRQTFVNAFDQPVEASYIFALPDRAAVQKCTATLGERVIEALLFERGEARKKYADAVEAGHRATLVEEDRPGCFTSTVGNLQPGEHAIIALSYSVELPIAGAEVTFRFPLVLAPRFTPGVPLPGPSVGAGTASDTSATPDASRVSPPVLVGGASGVQLSLSVRVHHAGVTPESLRTPLHTVTTLTEPRATVVQLAPGERMDRDFILRYRLFGGAGRSQLFLARDGVGEEGTWQLCFLPPAPAAPRPLDLVFLLDRSGSMEGWKLETARAALSKMLGSLRPEDRFALFAFDNALTSPLPSTLSAASAANLGLATTFLAQLTAQGGTELARALEKAASMSWSGPERDKVVVLITDGQVTNEDELVRITTKLQGVRLCAVGIDQAVNDGLLRRLAELTGGSVELVESAARLTEAMERVAQTALPPVLADVSVSGEGLELMPGQTAPPRAQSAYQSDTLVLRGRFRGPASGSVIVSGRRTDGSIHREAIEGVGAESDALAALWARASLRALEDRYAAGLGSKNELRKELVSTSLRFGVLCRFTAFCAVDRDSKVASSEHRVLQPVEPPRGWAEAATPGRYSGGRQAAAGRAMKTQAGILKGKFAFMSPEQIRGLPLDPRSEVFVLGSILWEALSGERLFSGDSDFTILEAIRTAKVPDVMPPGIPPAFEGVLRRALAKDPAHRYANGGELADALEVLRVDCPPAPSLGDFVTATCPTEVQAWQQRLARALTQAPPPVGRCGLVAKFNQGGLTTDWLAVREGAGGTTELILVERLIPWLAEDEEFLTEYLEAVSFGASHPGVVALLGVSGDVTQLAVAYELVRGVHLQQLLSACRKAKKTLPLRLALDLVVTVGRTLAFMNELPDDDGNPVGSVHRALSPTKILISFEGAVKVAGLSAPPAERYRAPVLVIHDDAPAPARPIVTPLPAPSASPRPSLTTRLKELFKPRRDQFWK